MTSQSAVIEDTILAMKRVINKNKADAFSDSDSEPAKPTNRGNKLKRKSQYFHEGQLGGRRPYRRKIEHAGYTRHILQRNPKRYDEEGYELFDDDTDEEADEEAAAKNPYHDVHIEKILMPLTQASDLHDHPSLSLPYRSKTLPTMVQDACEMLHKERKTLAGMKALLSKLRGDPTWIPLGVMESDNDAALFGTYPQPDGSFATASLEPTVNSLVKAPKLASQRQGADQASRIAVNGLSVKGLEVEHITTDGKKIHGANGTQNGSMGIHEKLATDNNTNEPAEGTAGNAMASGGSPSKKAKPDTESQEQATNKVAEADTEMKDAADEPAPTTKAHPTEQANIAEPSHPDHNNETNKSSNPPTPSEISSPSHTPPRMLTRGRANAHTSPSPQPQSQIASPSSPLASIHPLFLPPASSVADREFGLPPPEAEESRRVLIAWIQKQEEVCRGTERLYEGLLKAQRLRDTVWRWSRAEGHVGEMSDGEDWVDMEEWGLEAPLKKGAEEGAVEEEGKKTRARAGK